MIPIIIIIIIVVIINTGYYAKNLLKINDMGIAYEHKYQ